MTENRQDNFPTKIVTEGKIKIIAPNLKAYGVCPQDYAPSKAPVFYNPVMELNRDLTVLAFQVYQHTIDREVTICDPLTGTGIRGIRFATEIHGVKQVVGGDINLRSVELAVQNVALNSLQDRVTIKHKHANRLLIEHSAPKKRFNIVDIDPFGTPIPHIDSAVQATNNHGLLAATATDMAPLCGVHPRACIRKYGGKPLRTEYCQELAVRFLAGSIASMAAKHDIGIHVLFSQSSDHYIRLYAQLEYGCQKADNSQRSLGYILHCFHCLHRETAHKPFPEKTIKCPECGANMDWAGPLWLGIIFERQFVERMLKENERRAFSNANKIAKLLGLIRDEADAPITYYVLDKVSAKLKLPTPPVKLFLETLRKNGYLAVPTHFNTLGFRTDAPSSIVQDTLKKMAAFEN